MIKLMINKILIIVKIDIIIVPSVCIPIFFNEYIPFEAIIDLKIFC